MRTTLFALTLFAIALIMPGASAHPEGSGSSGYATAAGFAPFIVVVPSGSSVGWEALDLPHTFTEGSVLDSGPRCFNVFLSPSGSASFRLEVVDGATQLQAYQTALLGWQECTRAKTQPGLGVVNFFCSIHPWMTGLLVVHDDAVSSASSLWHDPLVLMEIERTLGEAAAVTA